MNELISIIIPMRNGMKYLGEALESVSRQGMETEVIVIDDASDDGSGSFAQSRGCTVIRHEECRGQVAGKNTGIKAAHGKYIMFMDCDDIMRPGSLSQLYELLDNDSYAVMAKVKDFFSPEISEEQKSGASIKNEPYYGLFTAAVLIRKEAFDIIGPFNEKLNTGEILEWEFKMKSNGLGIKKADLISTDRRIHSCNYGRTDRKKEFADYLMVLRERLTSSGKDRHPNP